VRVSGKKEGEIEKVLDSEMRESFYTFFGFKLLLSIS
jgi:hypothetical protein